MKDIKSFIIGFLSCVCLILFMGAGKSENGKYKKLEADMLRVGSIVIYETGVGDKGFTAISSTNFQQCKITNPENIFDDFVIKSSLSYNDDDDAMLSLYDKNGERGIAISGEGGVYYTKESSKIKF